jgi:FKBP-type peptidyl-prolyl cis-trans isomerase
MKGTRYKLIGECVVFIVKSPDAILKRVLTELKQVKKIKSKVKRKRKTKRKKSKKSTRKKKSGIYTAKNGRKYEILESGKARFI